jgi:hypothetical protein
MSVGSKPLKMISQYLDASQSYVTVDCVKTLNGSMLPIGTFFRLGDNIYVYFHSPKELDRDYLEMESYFTKSDVPTMLLAFHRSADNSKDFYKLYFDYYSTRATVIDHSTAKDFFEQNKLIFLGNFKNYSFFKDYYYHANVDCEIVDDSLGPLAVLNSAIKTEIDDKIVDEQITRIIRQIESLRTTVGDSRLDSFSHWARLKNSFQ